MPHYRVTITNPNERLIEAKSSAQAENFATATAVKVEKLNTGQAIAMTQRGIKVEDATKDPQARIPDADSSIPSRPPGEIAGRDLARPLGDDAE